MLLHKMQKDAEVCPRGAEVLRLGLSKGDAAAKELGYVPMPARGGLVEKSLGEGAEGRRGQAVWSAAPEPTAAAPAPAGKLVPASETVMAPKAGTRSRRTSG